MTRIKYAGDFAANAFRAKGVPWFDVTHPDYGAVGDGVADDHAAIVSAASAASTAATTAGIKTTVLVPAGVICKTNTAIDWPANVDLQLDGAIKAGAVMSYVLQTPLNTLAEDQAILGRGFIYCDSMADVGIDLQYTRHFRVEGVCVEDYLVAGLRTGNGGAPSTSYETIVNRFRTHRRSAAVVAGSVGLYIRSATDCIVSDTVLIGAEVGLQVDTGGQFFSNVHCWTRPSTGAMQKGFYDQGSGNTYVGCYADTPTVYGWHLTGFNANLLGCYVSNTVNGGLDNVMSAVRLDQSAPSARIVGLFSSGADSSHRILKDIDSAGGYANITVIGNSYGNVTNPFGSGSVTDRLRIGAGTVLTKTAVYTPSYTPSAVSAQSISRQTFTCTGLTTADKVVVNPPSSAVNVAICESRVSAADTLEITFVNPTGGSVTPTSGVYTVLAIRS